MIRMACLYGLLVIITELFILLYMILPPQKLCVILVYSIEYIRILTKYVSTCGLSLVLVHKNFLQRINASANTSIMQDIYCVYSM